MFELIKQGTKFDFMSKTKIFFIVSGLLVLLSLAQSLRKGLTSVSTSPEVLSFR